MPGAPRPGFRGCPTSGSRYDDGSGQTGRTARPSLRQRVSVGSPDRRARKPISGTIAPEKTQLPDMGSWCVTADLAATAMETLDRNRRGGWTCPAAGIYPHRWLWDSCFVAIGLAGADPHRAAEELRSVLEGQWTNGMVPHMVFTPDVPDLGSTRLWQSRRDPRAPRAVNTSCITQPPILAIAAWYVAQDLDSRSRATFLAEVVPKIVEHHRWLYRKRDPDDRGLVTLIHRGALGRT